MNRRSIFGFLAGLPFLGFLSKAQASSGKKVHDTCPVHPNETFPRWPVGRAVPKSTSLARGPITAPGRIGFANPGGEQEYYCIHCLAELARNSDVTRLAHEGFNLKSVI